MGGEIGTAANPSSGSNFVDNILIELGEAFQALVGCHEKIDRMVGRPPPEGKDQTKQAEDSAFSQGQDTV